MLLLSLLRAPDARVRPPRGCATDDSAAALAQWLDLCGAERNGVVVGCVDGMRGLVPSQPLSRGLLSTELLKVPAALALSDSDEELRDTAFGQAVPCSEWLMLQPDAKLALWLLEERKRGKASPWYHYIQLLPAHVPTGRHLPSAAIELILDQVLKEQVQQAARYVPELHEHLVAVSARHGGEAYSFSEAELGWALDIVHSRSFTVDAGSRGLRRCATPSTNPIPFVFHPSPPVSTVSSYLLWTC